LHSLFAPDSVDLASGFFRNKCRIPWHKLCGLL
jgi:hypothetical protein